MRRFMRLPDTRGTAGRGGADSRRDRRQRVVRSAVLTAALLAAALTPAAAVADRVGETPPFVRTYVAEAHLSGAGRLKWYGFSVYDARLYVPAGFDAANAFTKPFVLELTYARSVGGASIADTSRDEIERLGFGTPEQRAAWLQAMVRLFPDVRERTALAGVFLPGEGARFYRDGEPIGAINDPAFARAFFAIWLDERTQAPDLRQRLLGLDGDRPGARG